MEPKRKGGRPTDCTPNTVTRLAAAIAEGHTIEVACFQGGITHTTWSKWMMRGTAGEEPYAGFVAAIREAMAKAEEKLTKVVINAATEGGDWRAALALLERRHPDRWSKRTEISGPGGAPVPVAVDLRAEVRAQAAALTATDLGIPVDVLPDGEG